MRITKEVRIGSLKIGGGNPVWVQSMCNTNTRDVAATVAQIQKLEEAGCQIVRVSVLDSACATALKDIKSRIHIPLVADIHFRADLALSALYAGVDKLRINPGNIGNAAKIRRVSDAARERNIPIRVGVNSGSLRKDLLARYGGPTAEALVTGVLEDVAVLERCGFENIVLSVKSTDIQVNLEANRILAEKLPYPIHLGLTESGIPEYGIIKSAAGLSPLLMEGIGDTLRISLTGDPLPEVMAGFRLLRACGRGEPEPEIISCPTCGRRAADVEGLARQLEIAVRGIRKPLKIASLGCLVTGPGEASQADIGIAGGYKYGLLFKKGKSPRKVPSEELFSALLAELEEFR